MTSMLPSTPNAPLLCFAAMYFVLLFALPKQPKDATLLSTYGLLLLVRSVEKCGVPLYLWRFLTSGNSTVVAQTVGTGMIFCTVGDLALEILPLIPPKPIDLFIVGLVAFLIGHCFYVYAFSLDAAGTNFAAAAALVAFAAIMYGGVLLPKLPSTLRGPVLVYICVISGMKYAALARWQEGSVGPQSDSVLHGALGAGLFVLSDSILAVNKFVRPLPGAKVAIMLTYYAAQTYIASAASLAGVVD